MEIQVQVRRIGNSWGIIIPKEAANTLQLTEKVFLHVKMDVIGQLKELKGTFKTKKTITQLNKEIDEGWE